MYIVSYSVLLKTQRAVKVMDGMKATISKPSSRACIKYVCVSVVWAIRQLPRCHHTGQR